MKVEQFGLLRNCDSVETNLARANHYYNRYLAESNNGEHSLLKAIFRVFMGEILIQTLLNTIIATLTFGAPFLVMLLIDFITSENAYPELPPNCWQNIEWGVYYSLALVLS